MKREILVMSAFNQQSFVTSPCHLGLKSMGFFITVGDIDKLKEQQVLGNRSSLSATLLFWVLSFRGITTSRWKSLSPLAVLPHLFEFSHKNRCKREHHIKIIGWRKHQLMVTMGNKRNNQKNKKNCFNLMANNKCRTHRMSIDGSSVLPKGVCLDAGTLELGSHKLITAGLRSKCHYSFMGGSFMNICIFCSWVEAIGWRRLPDTRKSFSLGVY
jgi:hypothetical protein